MWLQGTGWMDRQANKISSLVWDPRENSRIYTCTHTMSNVLTTASFSVTTYHLQGSKPFNNIYTCKGINVSIMIGKVRWYWTVVTHQLHIFSRVLECLYSFSVCDVLQICAIHGDDLVTKSATGRAEYTGTITMNNEHTPYTCTCTCSACMQVFQGAGGWDCTDLSCHENGWYMYNVCAYALCTCTYMYVHVHSQNRLFVCEIQPSLLTGLSK